MACLQLTLAPLAPALLSVNAVEGASLSVGPGPQAEISVTPVQQALLSVAGCERPSLNVLPVQKTVLTIGEVCSVSPGELTVLAASDGPLRTRDGGYLLLDPANEQSS